MEMEMEKVNQEAGVGLLETALSIILLSFALIFLWRGYNKNENYYHATEVAKITCNFANEFAEHLSTSQSQSGNFTSKNYQTQTFGDYEVKMHPLSDNLVTGLVLLKQKKTNNISPSDIISNLGFTAAKVDNNLIKSIDGVYEIDTGKYNNIKQDVNNAIAAVIIPSKLSNLMICNKGW